MKINSIQSNVSFGHVAYTYPEEIRKTLNLPPKQSSSPDVLDIFIATVDKMTGRNCVKVEIDAGYLQCRKNGERYGFFEHDINPTTPETSIREANTRFEKEYKPSWLA